MKDSYFNGVKDNGKVFKLSKFLDNGDFFCEADCSNNRVLPTTIDLLFTIPLLSSSLQKIYNVEGKLYYLYQDGYLYEGNWNTLKKVTENKFTSIVKVLKAPSNFGNSILIIDGKNALIRGEFNGNVYIPEGQEYLIYEDTIFLFNKNSLFFDCHTDDDFLLKDDFFGRIDVPKSLGNIIHLEAVSNKLIVFCEYGISTLSILDDKKDYKLVDSIAMPLSIREKSIKKIGDDCYFVCGKKLCKYYNQKVSFVPFFLENKDYVIFDESFSLNDLYCLPITYNGNNYVYQYSTLCGNQKIVDVNGKHYADGGFVFESATRKVYLLDSGENQTFTWESKSLDFDSEKIKYIKKICVHGKGAFSLSLLGNIENKTFNLNANESFNRLNFKSNKFSVSITSTERNACIDEIEIYYTE
ncbi:MAG: hypothetical protein KBS91_00635 [Firmicutes bacterium]|nr:hypothetical protein [Candidatus Caballimonas caccae]